MYVSAVRAYSGLELKDKRPKCIEIVSVENFTGLDDTEGGLVRWLYTLAGIGRTERRGETAAITGYCRSPYWN